MMIDVHEARRDAVGLALSHLSPLMSHRGRSGRAGQDEASSISSALEHGAVEPNLSLQELDVVDGLLEHRHGVHLGSAGDEALQDLEPVADAVPPTPGGHALRVGGEPERPRSSAPGLDVPGRRRRRRRLLVVELVRR